MLWGPVKLHPWHSLEPSLGTSPGPSPQQVPNSVRFSSPETAENSEMISETFWVWFLVSTPRTPPIQEMMWREISYMFEVPCVSFRLSLVSLSPDSLLCWDQNGGMSWSGCWRQLRALRVYTLQSQPLQFSLLQQLSTTFRQRASAFNWTFLALLDRSAGLLQIIPAITYALKFFFLIY